MNSHLHSTHRLETALRRGAPPSSPPAELHDSILRAVRRSAAPASRPSVWPLWKTLAVTACVLLLTAGVWWIKPQGSTTPDTLRAAATTLEHGRELPQQAPAVMLAPLSREFDALNRDLRSAVDMLVASVP